MRTEETTKIVKQYIADDGTNFGEDRAACELYEFNNPYVNDIGNIPTLDNIKFFFQEINGYWCKSQEDIDLCCQYFQEYKRQENLKNNKRNENMNYLDCICVGRFVKEGYYFIIKVRSDVLDSYGMFSLEQLENYWKVFLAQIPVSPEHKEELRKMHDELNEYALQKNNETIDETEDIDNTEEFPNNVKEIFENIAKKSMIDNKKIMPKIYTSDNLEAYKLERKSKEDISNE